MNKHEQFSLDDGIVVEDCDAIFSPRMKRVLNNQRYELLERRAVNRMLRKGDKVLELGAGCGAVAACAARVVGAENVTCVEANPALISTITNTLAINGQDDVSVVNAVAGLMRGTTDFYISDNFWASSLDPETPNLSKVLEVEVVNTKRLLRQTGANVLICDIEGAEFDLLPELKLSVLDVIIIELHPTPDNFVKTSALFEAITKAGLYLDMMATPKSRVSVFRRVGRDALDASSEPQADSTQ